MKIKNEIKLPYPVSEMSQEDLITEIAVQIRDCGDKVKLPIFRIGKEYRIYQYGKPIELPQKNMKKFLMLVANYVTSDSDAVRLVSFQRGLWGACWRLLAPEE